MSNSYEILQKIKNTFKKYQKKGTLLSLDECIELSQVDHLPSQEKRLLTNWFDQILNWKFLQILDDSFEEIFIHGPENIYYQKMGEHYPIDCDLTSDDLQLAMECLCLKEKMEWNYSSPFASFFSSLHGHHFRVSLIHFSSSPEKCSKIFLRNIQKKPFPLNRFCTPEQTLLLQKLVDEKKNIIISGPTGSGKTSLINALLDQVSQREHLIILEDTWELTSPHQNCTRFLQGETPESSLKSYLAYAMRMSPDRLILGEMRSNEVAPFLLAINSGHRGILSSVHANSASETLSRIVLLFSLHEKSSLSYNFILKFIAQNIDYVIYVENKKIKEISKIYGSEEETIFSEPISLFN